MRAKVCGLTTLSDALEAYRAGAAALGFIFVESSPRYISPDRARELNRHLPPFCLRVGVFADQPIEEILEICGGCRLSAIQLHGQTEDRSYIEELYRRTPLPIIRAIRLRLGQEVSLLTGLNPNHVQACMLDGADITADQCRQARDHLLGRPLILAGGLNADNISERVHELSPDAIDICSGLESVPGLKDFSKIHQFFQVIAGL